MKKLKVGVIGLGMGRWHIAGYREHKACEVLALADPDTKRLAEIGGKFKVPRLYDSPAEMLKREDLDIVSVATPNKFHKPWTVAALKAGAHVLCEKPMAMNAGEAREMLAVARKARRRIGINFSYRFTGAARALKRETGSGRTGKFYFGRTMWHRNRGMPGFGGWFGRKELAGGGPLIDLGVHRLDLALWLMGYPKPVLVMAGAYDAIAAPLARKARKAFSVEDLAGGVIKFANGATLVVEASWAGNIPESELMETRLWGTKAGLIHRNIVNTYNFEAVICRAKKDGGVAVEKLPPSPGKSAMHDFVEAIVRGRPHNASGEEGLVVMELLDALYASAKAGKPIRV